MGLREEDYDTYFWKFIDLDGKVVVDAGTGAGGTTEAIANKAIETGASCEIVSIDIDRNDIKRTSERLGDKRKYVKFLCADLRDIPAVATDSVDIVFCTYTVCAVDSNPFDSLRMFSEFHRILKEGGRIVIEEDFPHPTKPKQEHKVWTLKWTIERSLQHLCNISHFREISPENLSFALRLLGFNHIEWKLFEGGRLGEHSLDWFDQRAHRYAELLENPVLNRGFVSEIDKLKAELDLHESKFLDFYVLHATHLDKSCSRLMC